MAWRIAGGSLSASTATQSSEDVVFTTEATEFHRILIVTFSCFMDSVDLCVLCGDAATILT